MNPNLKRGVWTGIFVGVACMFLADLITMIPALQTVSGVSVTVIRWIIFAALVLIATFVAGKMIRK